LPSFNPSYPDDIVFWGHNIVPHSTAQEDCSMRRRLTACLMPPFAALLIGLAIFVNSPGSGSNVSRTAATNSSCARVHTDIINADDIVTGPGRPVEFYEEHFKQLPPDQQGGVAACFAPGTSPDVIDFVERSIYGAGQRYIL